MWEHGQMAGNTQTGSVPASELGPVIYALPCGHMEVRALLQKGTLAKKWGPRQGQHGGGMEAGWEGREVVGRYLAGLEGLTG